MARDRAAPFETTELFLRAPAPGELRVKIVAAGVCHTDVKVKQDGLCSFPIVMGHEGAGVVDTVGSDVAGFEVGDHVLLSYDACGRCPQCQRQKPSYCDHHGTLNFAGTRPDGSKTHRRPESDAFDVFGSFFQQSSFATYALSHPSNTIKVDASLPLRKLAPLGCGVQTGAGTVLNTLGVESGSSLAVFGCGSVGLSAILAAKLCGADPIIAVDINPIRLEKAMALGAHHGVAPSEFSSAADLVARVRAIPGANGCRYAVDSTGVPSVLRQAFDCCGPLGVTAMIAPGVPGTEVSIEMLGLLPGKSLRGVIQGDSDAKTFIPRLIDLWQQGDFPFDELITEYDSLDAVETAVVDMNAGKVIKPVIVIDDGVA